MAQSTLTPAARQRVEEKKVFPFYLPHVFLKAISPV
jgi:hypothetical protein